ncbi:MAG: hypothetical protein QOF68_992 [Gaiellales bacterium]|nr:hypothetical protein [Gaiellales bacterium]
MHRRLSLGLAAMLAVFVTTAASSSAAPPAPPKLRVFTATTSVELQKFRDQPITLDVHAYVSATGGDFRVDASRETYADAIVAHQVIGSSRRALPAWVVNEWFGLRDFVRYTVRNAQGKVVATADRTFCPAGYNVQRVDDSGPPVPTFPVFCGTNPFTKGMVWGIDRGWATSLDFFDSPTVKLPLGRYTLTINIPKRYAQLFNITPKDASTTVKLHVVKATDGCKPPCGHGRPARHRDAAGPASAPTVTAPDPSSLPDLIPLPSWSIGTARHLKRDYLEFGANVWNRGPAPLVVEGFRRPGKNIMDAFQYFYKDGVAVGRAAAGTMAFDSRGGHEHWHFKQFVEYSLLNSTKSEIVRSQKEAFCLVPTDAIDLTAPNAEWNPFLIGLPGACGDVGSLWIRETLPVGWGDTYYQSLPGQSFDITGLKNGKYFIRLFANPTGVIHEANTGNNTQLRLVILGGTPGHRTVKVPPYHGIDTH